MHNLIHGQILAAEHLVDGGTSPGQAYFINDGEPMNYWRFFQPLIEGLGYSSDQIESLRAAGAI